MAGRINEEKQSKVHVQSPNGRANIRPSRDALVRGGQRRAVNLPNSSITKGAPIIQTAKRRQMIGLRRRMDRLSKRNASVDPHIDDAALEASMGKTPLDGIINEYKFLYVTPLYWTHRHEKVLHVVWQPFQHPASPASVSPQCSRHLTQQKRRQQRLSELRLRSQRKASQNLILGVRRKPRRRLVWNNKYRSLLTPSQLQVSLSLRRLSPPSPPPSFVLVKIDHDFRDSHISFLEDSLFRAAVSMQQSLQRMLSGVDKRDSVKAFGCVPTLQSFLRLEQENLRINYGNIVYPILHDVPVYRLNTKIAGSSKSNGQNHAPGGWQSETCETKTNRFWRLVHLDQAHIEESMIKSHKYSRNFRDFGIVAKGMTMEEATVRYNYAAGDDKWSHPHFIPGIFIAMEQRYRWNKWAGQKECGEKLEVQGDTRDGQQEGKGEHRREHKHGGKHPHQHKKYRTSKLREGKGDAPRKPTTSDPAPTWQILFTDSPNDRIYAHVYTTQVPDLIITSLDRPAQRHWPNAPPQSGTNGTNDAHHEDIQFEFLIRHTRITYRPYESFRKRLREAIISSRDSFGALKETQVRR